MVKVTFRERGAGANTCSLARALCMFLYVFSASIMINVLSWVRTGETFVQISHPAMELAWTLSSPKLSVYSNRAEIEGGGGRMMEL